MLADLDRNDGGRLEIVAPAMDRHLYAWGANDSAPGTPGGAQQLSGYPVLVVDPEKVASVVPTTHAITFKPDAASEQQGAIIDTPAVGDIDDDDLEGENERPEIVLGTNEEYAEDLNAGNVTNATLGPLGESGLLGPGNSRLYALQAGGDDDGDPLLDDSTLYPGDWPFPVGIVITGLLPVVGEGITGNPVIGPVECPPQGAAGDTGPNIGTLANNGPAYILNPDASSCYGDDPTNGRPNALSSEQGQGPLQVDRPVLPAVGHPAFGALAPGPLTFFSPAAGIVRALDLALPEYQPTGQDFLAAWNTGSPSGSFQPGFPATVNDLQFLTGPSIADIDGAPGEEAVAGTASKDLAAFSAAGGPADPTRWPKATTDWTVANPLIGSFGTQDTEAGATKVVINATRSGYLHAYRTSAPACSASSWPRFHHDNANSGDWSRDAVLPGRPYDAVVATAGINFRAPGDDLLCGTATRYEIVTSNSPIDESNFAQATPLGGAPDPTAPGSLQSYVPPASALRYIAIRAVDEQGNVGRVLAVDFRGAPPTPPPPGGGGGGGGQGGDGACSNRVIGTSGKDRLRGTPGSDLLRGRAGRDRLSGRGGDDCLKGGRAKDRLRGGGGDDEIRARRGGRDRVRCGAGKDVAYVNPKRDRVGEDCEKVREGG